MDSDGQARQSWQGPASRRSVLHRAPHSESGCPKARLQDSLIRGPTRDEELRGLGSGAIPCPRPVHLRPYSPCGLGHRLQPPPGRSSAVDFPVVERGNEERPVATSCQLVSSFPSAAWDRLGGWSATHRFHQGNASPSEDRIDALRLRSGQAERRGSIPTRSVGTRNVRRKNPAPLPQL